MTLPNFDYNAGAAPDARVLDAMRALGPAADGNPHAAHSRGRAARAVLEEARERVASSLGFRADEVVFCSGGTEANNLALSCGVAAAEAAGRAIAVSPVEHPSIAVPAGDLRAHRPDICSILKWTPDGFELPESRAGFAFVSCTYAQGEFGFLPDIPALREQMERDLSGRDGAPGLLVHSDASQALGRLSLRRGLSAVDLVTLSPHKCGGPRGVGVLLVRDGAPFQPVMRGGSQELGRRPGTQSPRLAHGAALAIELAEREWQQRARSMRESIDEIVSAFAGERSAGRVQVLGVDVLPRAHEALLPNTRTLQFLGVSSRVLLPALDVAGIAVSYGSACSSGAEEASPSLLALGLSRGFVESCLRVSVAAGLEKQKVGEAAALFLQVLERIRPTSSTTSR